MYLKRGSYIPIWFGFQTGQSQWLGKALPIIPTSLAIPKHCTFPDLCERLKPRLKHRAGNGLLQYRASQAVTPLALETVSSQAAQACVDIFAATSHH